jgi:hypothetical protein
MYMLMYNFVEHLFKVPNPYLALLLHHHQSNNLLISFHNVEVHYNMSVWLKNPYIQTHEAVVMITPYNINLFNKEAS